MAIRVGIDLVAVDSIRESIATHGDRYLDRVYSPGEIADCRAATEVDPGRLAARFAAKEAVFKALRVGDEAVSWREVEIQRNAQGSAILSLSGKAARLADRVGVNEMSLSITHARGCAAAIVIVKIQKAGDVRRHERSDS